MKRTKQRIRGLGVAGLVSLFGCGIQTDLLPGDYAGEFECINEVYVNGMLERRASVETTGTFHVGPFGFLRDGDGALKSSGYEFGSDDSGLVFFCEGVSFFDDGEVVLDYRSHFDLSENLRMKGKGHETFFMLEDKLAVEQYFRYSGSGPENYETTWVCEGSTTRVDR